MHHNLLCNFNGRVTEAAKAPFSSGDDAFRLRYGLYETVLVRDGKIIYEERHRQRLEQGLKVLGFSIPGTFLSLFARQMLELVQENNLSDLCRARLQVFTDDERPPYHLQYLMECFELKESIVNWVPEGINVGILENFRKEIKPESNCKISHNKHFLPARAIMEQCRLDDMLLFNEYGNIIESAMANLFWVKDAKVFTPPLSEGCLAGTMRAAVIAGLQKNNIHFEEKAVTLPGLMIADEVFLTNSIRRMRWVKQIGEQVYSDGFSKKLYRLLFP